MAARGVGRERHTGSCGGGWHPARPPSRGPGATQGDNPRNRRQHSQGARLLGKGGSDGGRAGDGQRYHPGEGGALAAPGGRLRAGAGDALLRVGRLRLLRPRRSDAHALRRRRGRPEHPRRAAPPPAVPATGRSGGGRRPLPGRRLCRRDGPSRTGTRGLMGRLEGKAAVVTGEVRGIVGEVIETFGRIDVLVNNAGVLSISPLEQMPVEEWDRVLAINLRGTFLCCRFALPHMLRHGEGKIVNVASQLGQVGAPGLAHYSASKGGIIAFTKALAREVAARGVLVNAVAPGPI